MKNIIEHFYIINIDNIIQYSNYSFIESNKQYYIFKEYNNDIELTKYIINTLNNHQIKHHELVLNINNEILTKYDKKSYIMLKLLNNNEIINDNFFYIELSYKETNIPKLWSNKMDYYMMQIRNLALGKELIINTFNYYLGLAENAISLYNMSLKLEDKLTYEIVHKRVGYPNYEINYFDPTNMIIDIKGRDIAEYVKSKFFNDNISVEETIRLINKYQLNNKELNILNARLLYPSYYFDLYEDIIIDDQEENIIIDIANKLDKYELFLKELFKEESKYYHVIGIDWLKK